MVNEVRGWEDYKSQEEEHCKDETEPSGLKCDFSLRRKEVHGEGLPGTRHPELSTRSLHVKLIQTLRDNVPGYIATCQKKKITWHENAWVIILALIPRMAVACLVILGRFILDSVGESVNSLVSDCCSERLILNDSCPVDQRCSPGCYQVWTNNGSIACVKCNNETGLEVSRNLTECRDVTTQASEIHMNISTTPSVPHHLSNPGVAASLLLGTLFISLFLVLSVASFFYLKRSHMLPEIFYRRNKASILQPSEMASMIPEPNTSGRKPRYVRRERTHKAAAPVLLDPSADTQVSNV